MRFRRDDRAERGVKIEIRPAVCRCCRRNVIIHLANQVVDESGVRLSEDEVSRLWIVGAAEVVELGASKCREHLAKRVNQIRISLTIRVDDDSERLERGCLLIEIVAGINADETRDQRNRDE